MSQFVIFVIFFLSSINGELQDDCADERCCKVRNGVQNDLCASMTLKECVGNDDSCYWNCDKEEDDLFFLGARGHGNFVGFSNGKGVVHDYKDDGSNNNEAEKNQESDTDAILKMKSADEFAQYTSYKVFGKCGDIYEYKLPTAVAQSRLNKIIRGKKVHDVSKDYFTDKKLDLDELEEEKEKQDIDEEAKRRLTIFSPDGRTQSTLKNTWPYRTIGKLISSSGSCSATLISRRVLLTAAHCVYDTENNDFISNRKFYPDATSSSDITITNEYYGTSAMVFNSWIDVTCCASGVCCAAARDWDIAVIRLSVTNTGKGWMSIGYDSGLGAPQYLNTYGYPGDKAWGTKWTQYCEYTEFYTDTFRSNICDVYGGQSGSSVYKYWGDSGSRIIYGVVVSGNSAANTYCRITSTKFDSICDYIDAGETTIC